MVHLTDVVIPNRSDRPLFNPVKAPCFRTWAQLPQWRPVSEPLTSCWARELNSELWWCMDLYLLFMYTTPLHWWFMFNGSIMYQMGKQEVIWPTGQIFNSPPHVGIRCCQVFDMFNCWWPVGDFFSTFIDELLNGPTGRRPDLQETQNNYRETKVLQRGIQLPQVDKNIITMRRQKTDTKRQKCTTDGHKKNTKRRKTTTKGNTATTNEQQLLKDSNQLQRDTKIPQKDTRLHKDTKNYIKTLKTT